MGGFATGKNSKAISDRSGMNFLMMKWLRSGTDR